MWTPVEILAGNVLGGFDVKCQIPTCHRMRLPEIAPIEFILTLPRINSLHGNHFGLTRHGSSDVPGLRLPLPS